MSRAHYESTIGDFLQVTPDIIIGALTQRSPFPVERPQVQAWREQVGILQSVLTPYAGKGYICFEFELPRLGRRIDVALILGPIVFVLEFKVGEREFDGYSIDQVWDYALDLKNFHEPSHTVQIVPVLVATHAQAPSPRYQTPAKDGVHAPTLVGAAQLGRVFEVFLARSAGPLVDGKRWAAGRYSPTPTIVEVARALWSGHSVADISRNDAGASNLTHTATYVSKVIAEAQQRKQKAICLITGVPGAGKTLVGLDIATRHMDPTSDLYSVFLSGNGPLVAILREALARDRVQRERLAGRALGKGEARRQVETFIQNVHHFRDDCLVTAGPPPEHVAIFDEAQRAWNKEQTIAFMKRKKGRPDFNASEPEYLLSCMDRHSDWAVVLCLIGGGQEINTGEAGIVEWINALRKKYQHWTVYLSPRLYDSEYGSGSALTDLVHHPNVIYADPLHLGVSMRSFRAERVSEWVKEVLDVEVSQAQRTLRDLLPKYPIVLTRNLCEAKAWVRSNARGSERYGLVVSSQAQRLKPHAIDVRVQVDPVHWFLGPKEDVRSSFYLEDAATEFQVQGLELDWVCVVWDADFRWADATWDYWSFVGDRWQQVRKLERRRYMKNAYRVLLTRARQGMALVVPEGSANDPTRAPCFYDSTFKYLRSIGVPLLS